MELDFRKLNADKLFNFSKAQEQLIFEVYDRLFERYDLSVTAVEDSPFQRWTSGEENSLFTPEICYIITDRKKKNTFYLFIVSKAGTTVKGARTITRYDSLQGWGMKLLDGDYGFISVNRKKWQDRIAGIFSRCHLDFKDSRLNDFYILGSDRSKTLAFLSETRKEMITAFQDQDFTLQVRNNILNFGFPENLSVDRALRAAAFLKGI